MNFPKNFFLGAASSAWQTEGWKGKREGQDSYLDDWFKNDYFVWNDGKGPDIATNSMENYQKDIDLMKKIGLTHFRTSINWSRFLIDYENIVVDEVYAKHIDNVINALIAANIEPMLVLEHYEVPTFLQKKYGGWNSRKVVDLFVRYAKKVFRRYGNRVNYWFTFNEPIVPQTRVNLDGVRYPYDIDPQKWSQCNYHKVLATSIIEKEYHKQFAKGKIGIIHNWEHAYPRSSTFIPDVEAAHKFDLFHNRIIIDPLVKGTYPKDLITLMKDNKIMFTYSKEDLQCIRENHIDVLGLNIYFPTRVKTPEYQWNSNAPFNPRKYYDDFILPGRKMNTSRGWEMYPPLMRDIAKIIKEDYANFPWFVSENGMGISNEEQFRNKSGIIDDNYRINFIQENLYWLLKAIKEDGSSCQGYMLWAFTDCVSPMNAFKNRYGLIEIDLQNNLQRKMKKSAYFFQQLNKTRFINDETEFSYKD